MPATSMSRNPASAGCSHGYSVTNDQVWPRYDDAEVAAYPSVTNVVVVDSPAEKTPESVLTDDATVEVRAADPLAVTGGDLATGLLTGVALMLLLGAAVYAYGRRQRGVHAA